MTNTQRRHLLKIKHSQEERAYQEDIEALKYRIKVRKLMMPYIPSSKEMLLYFLIALIGVVFVIFITIK